MDFMSDMPRVPGWAVALAERARQNRLIETDYLWKYPERLFHKRDMQPDPWQMECLHSRQNLFLCASRQIGKSELTASVVSKAILCEAPCLILVLSPTDRQSIELLKTKIMPFLEPWLNRPFRMGDSQEKAPAITITKNNEFSKEFSNGSRIVALPGKNEGNIRSYSSVGLLVIDEASRVLDALYDAVTPMLAVSHGRKIVLSTPFGKRGWFYNQWIKGKDWKKVQITADQCPRLTKEFLDNERKAKGERVYKQEFCCSFEDAVGQMFPEWAIAQSVRDDIDAFDLFDESTWPKPVIISANDRVDV